MLIELMPYSTNISLKISNFNLYFPHPQQNPHREDPREEDEIVEVENSQNHTGSHHESPEPPPRTRRRIRRIVDDEDHDDNDDENDEERVTQQSRRLRNFSPPPEYDPLMNNMDTENRGQTPIPPSNPNSPSDRNRPLDHGISPFF